MSWEARAASQRDREFFSSNTRVSFATLPPTPNFHKIPGQQNFLLRPSWESDINVRRPVQDGALMVLSTAGVTRGDVAVAVVAIHCTGGSGRHAAGGGIGGQIKNKSTMHTAQLVQAIRTKF